MIPGVLTLPLPLPLMARVSPSRFDAFRCCALREVWAAGRVEEMLPPAPTARLGFVIHRLLEEAGKGELPATGQGAIQQRWDELVAEVEKEMSSSWLQRHLTPLSHSIPSYEVRRLQAHRRAAEIAARAVVCHPGAAGEAPASEHWVETPGGEVGGRIDYVAPSREGPILRDYKSGAACEEDASPGEVKASYRTQLHMYAAVYAVAKGHWPARLEIVPLDGPPIPVPFTPPECEALLRQAIITLRRVNQLIREAGTGLVAAQRALATPSPEQCRFCSYRPACYAYKDARLAAGVAERWPEDMWGVVQESRHLGNGKVLIALRPEGTGNSIIYVRGLSPDPIRHPALERLRPGDRVAVFNLVSPRSPGGALSESKRTALYLVPTPEDTPP